MIEEVNKTPRVSRLTLILWDLQHVWWGLEHWIATHLLELRFCHSCSGYFHENNMTLRDKCAACYARDYGVPVE